MVDGVDIYGGFAGYENGPNDRDMNKLAYATTLCGIILHDDNGNAYGNSTVEASNAVIDGFTITGSAAAGIQCDEVTATIRNCTIENNYYGIVSNTRSDKKLIIQNNRIGKNTGIGVNYTSFGPEFSLRNNLLYENTGDAINLGGVSCDVNICNNTIVNNKGKAVSFSFYYYSVNLRNCIIWSNGDPVPPWGSVTLHNCCIDESGWAGRNGNINEDPCFINSPSFLDVVYSGDKTKYSFTVKDGTKYDANGYIEIGYDGVARGITEVVNNVIHFVPSLSSLPEENAPIRYWCKKGFTDTSAVFDQIDMDVIASDYAYFYTIDIDDPNIYDVGDFIEITDSDGDYFGVLLVTAVDRSNKRVQFVEWAGVSSYTYYTDNGATVRDFKNWYKGDCKEIYRLRPQSACINMGSGFGLKDITTAPGGNNTIVVSDADFYVKGDAIEVNDDNTPRFVEDASGHIVTFIPPLNASSAASTQVINWTSYSSFEGALLFIYDQFKCEGSGGCIPFDSNSIKVAKDVKRYKQGYVLEFDAQYNNDYVVVTNVNADTNTIYFSPKLSNT